MSTTQVLSSLNVVYRPLPSDELRASIQDIAREVIDVAIAGGRGEQ